MAAPIPSNPRAGSPPAFPRPCPVCATLPAEPVFRQHFSSLEQGGLLTGYDVHACGTCGFGYASPLPSQAAFDDCYARLSKYEYSGGPPPVEASHYRWAAEFLKAQRGVEGRVLDVGCATGWLLEAMMAEGFTRLEGLEVSPLAAAEARGKGLEVGEGSLWTLDPAKGPWDLVIMGSILEHIRDLPDALEHVASLVPEGGQVYVEVPNAARYPDSTDAPFQEFNLEHINYFGKESLLWFMAVHGFRPVRLEATAGEYPPGLMSFELKGLFEKKAGFAPPLQKDRAVAEALASYVDISRSREATIVDRLEQIAQSGEPILVWGAGTHTQHLLETTPLRRCNIVAFVDRNPRYHGLRMAGREILAPDAVAEHPETVLIGSYQFQEAIEGMLRQTLGLTNPVIRLHSKIPPRP